MATSTPNLQLHKPDPGENVNVNQDLNANWDILDTEVADVSDLTRKGWVYLDHGTSTPPTTGFDIDLTRGGMFSAAAFAMYKVTLRGGLSAEGSLGIRVNNDSTADLHRRAMDARRLSDSTFQFSSSTDGTAWSVGRWGSSFNNISEILIHGIQGGTANLTIQGTAYRAGTGTGLRWFSAFGGDLSANRTISSLRVFCITTAVDIETVRWRAEGFRE